MVDRRFRPQDVGFKKASDLLDALHAAGEDAHGGFDDGYGGWFGWDLEGDKLTVSFTPADATDTSEVLIGRWQLVPLEG